MLKLVYAKSKKEVQVGDKIRSGREVFTVTGWQEPQHINSSGRIYVKNGRSRNPQSFFPHVFDCKFVGRA